MTHKPEHLETDPRTPLEYDMDQIILSESLPALEDTVPTPDMIRRNEDGQYYFFYTLEADKVEGLEEDVTVYYLSESNYKLTVDPGSAEEIANTAISFGSIEEVQSNLAGLNPIDVLISSIKKEADLNPYLVVQEDSGEYAVLGLFLESIFEGTPLTYEDYAYVSPTIAALNADQLEYFRAVALGSDREANATLRRLQDRTKIEVAGLISKYGQYDIPQDLINKLYDMRLKGVLSKDDLSEQFRLILFPELPGFRNDEIQEFIKDKQLEMPESLAFIQRAKDQAEAKLGMDLASLFKEEDYNFFSNVLATTNGQSLLDAKLQEVWDENVSDKYKGRDYNTSIIGVRTMANKYGNLDEAGRDKDLVYNLFQMDDPSEQRKAIISHFLEVGDDGALTKMAQGLKGQGLGQIYLSPTITGQG